MSPRTDNPVPMSNVEGFLGQRLDQFLDAIAAETPAPGGGSVAAVVVAMAAGLVAMAARFSAARWDEAEGLAERADELRRRVAPLAPADARAYEEVLTAFRLPRDLAPEVREDAVANALSHAAEVPLEIAREASEVAALAALVADRGNPNLRGDAVTAALLAAAGARAAANLVEINLWARADDPRRERAREHVTGAEGAARQAQDVGP